MAEEIVIGVATAAVVAVLARLGGLFQAPKNVEEWKVQVQRARKDYLSWRTRADLELEQELQRIDEKHNARGLYNSGIRIVARQKATDRVTRETEERLTTMSRAWDDAFRELRRVDKAWLVWTMKERGNYGIIKGTWKALFGRNASMEADILDPVLERLREREGTAGENGW